jgi:hypothetical protein
MCSSMAACMFSREESTRRKRGEYPHVQSKPSARIRAWCLMPEVSLEGLANSTSVYLPCTFVRVSGASHVSGVSCFQYLTEPSRRVAEQFRPWAPLQLTLSGCVRIRNFFRLASYGSVAVNCPATPIGSSPTSRTSKRRSFLSSMNATGMLIGNETEPGTSFRSPCAQAMASPF